MIERAPEMNLAEIKGYAAARKLSVVLNMTVPVGQMVVMTPTAAQWWPRYPGDSPVPLLAIHPGQVGKDSL